jgi:dTDP-4-dehydrorhamnose reductase
MRVLLLGGDGQVGHELRGMLTCFAELVCPSRSEADLGEPASVERAVVAARPDLVVNAAAYNDVDRAEKEPETALAVNGDAVAALGALAKRQRFALIHYSSDFVFDGEKGAPYVEDDPPSPLGAYAQSKLAGERALAELDAPAIVLRTAWVYSLRRRSFVSAILRLAAEREELQVVSDQVGSPTFCRDLAFATALLIERLGSDAHARAGVARGVYHVAGGGACSRFELARAVVELDPLRDEHRVQRISPITSSEYPLPARRPSYAPLDSSRFGLRFGIRLPEWRQALARALADRGRSR